MLTVMRGRARRYLSVRSLRFCIRSRHGEVRSGPCRRPARITELHDLGLHGLGVRQERPSAKGDHLLLLKRVADGCRDEAY